MQRLKRLGGPVLAITASLLLAACETLGIATNPAPPNASVVLRDVPEVQNSSKSPCWQQRQIAAQRGYIESATSGKKVQYHAECSDDTKPEPKAEAKTS